MLPFAIVLYIGLELFSEYSKVKKRQIRIGSVVIKDNRQTSLYEITMSLKGVQYKLL